MKKYLLVLLFASSTMFAQFMPPNPQSGYAGGGLGMSWIDGNPHYSFRFNPEISFANFGLGLDLLLEFDPSGNIRTENFKDFSDYLRVIRYARYGVKNDPVYIRVGNLDYATLGYGNILYLYNNSVSFDRRTVGLEFDLDFNMFGFEFVYGNFLQAGVTGLRGYVRPLQFTDLGNIPVIGNIEVGASAVVDFSENSGLIAAMANSDGDITSLLDNGNMTIYGLDVGVPLLNTSVVDLETYFTYTKIDGFGSGTTGGFLFDFSGLGLLDLKIKLERRWNTDQYISSYFNALYEVERLNITESGAVATKAQELLAATNSANGFYGGLFAKVFGMFDVVGSYQRLDKDPRSGLLHISSDVSPEGQPFIARVGYDKRNIIDEVDLFKLDDRSHAFFELGYKPMEYIIVSMVYHWTFSPERNLNGDIIGYQPQKRIEPSVRFVYPFDF